MSREPIAQPKCDDVCVKPLHQAQLRNLLLVWLPPRTVSGTVQVSASSSDNIGVSGVQFFLDGAILGAQQLGVARDWLRRRPQTLRRLYLVVGNRRLRDQPPREAVRGRRAPRVRLLGR